MSTFLHFRYFTVNEVLDQVLSSDATDSIFFIQPPETHKLRDEDSRDEYSFTLASMTRNQLLAECEF